MMKILSLFILLLSCVNIYAQTFTVSGEVRDHKTREYLIGAYLTSVDRSVQAITNEYGKFTFNVPAKVTTIEFEVSYLGYRSKTTVLKVTRDTLITISLIPLADTLSSVQVIGKRANTPPRSEGSTATIDVETIKRLPKLLGETDPIRSLQLLPGVQNGNEGSSALHVRGGSPDQNLVLLDGIPIFSPNHLGGFFSIVDADAVKTVTLYKGGFPARFANRLSSVVDVRLKEGSLTSWSRSFSLGLLSSKIAVSGPLIKNKLTVAATARRTNLDLLSQAVSFFQPDDAFVAGLYFYDGTVKVTYTGNDKNQFSLSAYFGKDDLFLRQSGSTQIDENTVTQKSRLTKNWGNQAYGLQWKHTFSPRMFSNYALSFTGYNYTDAFTAERLVENQPEETRSAANNLTANINTLTLRLHHQLSGVAIFKFGLLASIPTFQQPRVRLEQAFGGVIPPVIRDSGRRPLATTSVGAYIEYLPDLGDDWSVNFGLHADVYRVQSSSFPSLQPRLSIAYSLSESWSVFTHYAAMRQPLHLLSNSGGGAPTDLWLPATKRAPPGTSQQLSAGFAWSKGPWVLEVEGYLKYLHNQIEFRNGASFFSGGGDWQENVSTGGKGRVAGVEMLLKYSNPKFQTWAAYTYSRNQRTFSDINDGVSFPYRFDRPHQLTLVGLWQPKPKFNASCSITIESGNAITLPDARFEIEGVGAEVNQNVFNNKLFFGAQDAFLYGNRNNARLPFYHRLDINMDFIKYKTKKGIQRKRVTSLGLYNAYNRQNPYFVFYDTADDGSQQLQGLTLFPVVPYLSYKSSF